MLRWKNLGATSSVPKETSGRNIRALALVALLIVTLSIASASFAQSSGDQVALDTIRSQVQWVNSLVAAGKIDKTEASAQLKVLQLQAGQLALNVPVADPSTQTDAAVAEAAASDPAHTVADATATAAHGSAMASGAAATPVTNADNKNAKPFDLHDLPMTHFRGLIGVNVSGASAADPSGKFYANVAFEEPLGNSFNSSDKPAWFSLWGNFGLSSVAQPGTLSGVTSANTYLQSAVNASPQQIVQSIESQVGLAINPPKFQWYHNDAKSMQSLSFIVGGGVVTPLSPSQATPPLYLVTQSVVDAYLPKNPALTSACDLNSMGVLPANQKCYVAFFPQDRTRFFRDYGAGVRLKFYWADSNSTTPDNTNSWLRFPGNIDLAVGQSEYVTGGGLNGAILHIGGSMPVIPIDGLYVFGSMDVALSSSAVSKQPLLLQPSSNPNLAYTDPSVVAIQVPQPNRDRYAIGMGIDIVDFLKHFQQKKTTGQ